MIHHLKSIRTSGTIVPSSTFLVGRLLEGVDFASARRIVELGAGTGCVTREILRRMCPDARLVSLEINPVFVEACREFRDPRLRLVQGCAADLTRILREEDMEEVDAVVSSLPLSLMDDTVVERILDGVQACLSPDGVFTQYQYSLSNHARLASRYRDVGVKFALANVPPAFVYACTQRRATAPAARRHVPTLGSVYAAALAAVGVAVRAYQQL